MGQPDLISIRFEDAIEIVENLEYFLHKQLSEEEEKKTLKVVDSLKAKIQLHKELAHYYEGEEN